MHPSPRPSKSHRRISASCAALALLLGGVVFAEGEVRVSAEIVDESGGPVPGLTLVFTAEGDIPARDATTNKKGRATIPNLRAGSYRPSLESDAYRIQSIGFSARLADNTRQSFAEENALANGVPLITFTAFSRAVLDIVVVTRPEETADSGTTHAGALQGLQDAQGKLEVLNALFDLQRWDKLIEEADTLLAADPDLGGAHYLRGVALWRSGNLEEAEAAMTRAEATIPDQPGLHGVIGALRLDHANASRAAGDEAQAKELASSAIEALDRQLEATPGVKTHLVNKVIALEITGRTEETMVALRELIAVDAEDTRPYLRLAELQMDHGHAEQAVETIASIPGAGAEVADHLYNAAVVMWNEDKLDAVIATMVRAIELAPDNALPHQLKGRAHIAKGETAEGVVELEEFIRLSPPDEDTSTEQKLIDALKQQG